MKNKVIKLVFGTGVGQAVQLACLPVISRVYSSEALGEYGSLLAFSALLSVFVGMRMEFDYARASEEQKKRVINNFFSLSLVGSVFLFVVLLVGVGEIAFGGQGGDVLDYVLIVLLSLSLSLFQFNSVVLACDQEIGRLAIIKGVRGGVTSIVQSLAPLFFSATTGLIVLCDLVVRGFTSINSNRLVSGFSFDLSGAFSVHRVRVVLSSFLNQLATNAPYVILGYVWGAGAVGFYFLAQRSLGGPMALLGQSLSYAYVSELSKDIESNNPALAWSRVKVISVKSFALSFPVFIAVALAGYFFLGAIFGKEWSEYSDAWLLIMPLYCFRFSFSPVSQTLSYLGESGWQMLWELSRGLFVISALLLPAYFDIKFHVSMLIYSLVVGFCYVLLLFMIRLRLRRLLFQD